MTNALLVVLDTARRDAFEPYGAGVGASPTVADLARRGRAFSDVFATSCWTLPSHASLLAGVYPREVGLCQAPGETPLGTRPVVRGLADRLLPEVLRRAGWSTRAVTSNVWVSEAGGFDTGFDEFVNPRVDRQTGLDGGGLRTRLRWAAQGARGDVDDGAADAERAVRRWIDGWTGERFFWFVNLMECHSPYLPPTPYGDMGPVARARAADEARRHLNLAAIWCTCVSQGFDVPDGALERMRQLYAGAIRYMDDWLGRVLETMDARGMLDDTLVIITSDHGENFGEGGLLTHAYSLDDRLTKVPFVAFGPGAPERLTSLIEVPGLVASALGLDEHPWAKRQLPDAAVAQWDPPGSASDPRVIRVMDQWKLDASGRARMVTPLTTASNGRFKLQRRGGTEELFDLELDPLELHATSPVGPVADGLRAALEAPAASAVASGRPTDGANDPSAVSDLEARMRLLGYM